MSEQETLKLVAEVVDKYSGPLKQMMDSLKKLGDGTKDLHEKGRKHTDEHTKAYQRLREQIVQFKTKGLDIATPALDEMGVTIMGVSAAAATMGAVVVKAAKDWAEFGQKLTFAHRASGLTMDTMRGLAEANQKFGASADDTLGSLEKFGAHMDQFHRKSWDYINQWKALGGDAFVNIGSKLMALDGDREAQLKKAMEIVPQIRDVDQRKRVLALLGLPENWASLTEKEMNELRRKGEEFTKAHHFNVEGARKLKEAWEEVSSSIRGLETDLGNTFGPVGVTMLNGYKTMLDNIDSTIMSIKNHLPQWGNLNKSSLPADRSSVFGRMLFGKASPNQRVTEGFDALGKKDTEDSIAKGTRQGMLDALRDYKAQSQSEFAPGLVPQAFHPGGGMGGGGGGKFGSKDYPALTPEQADAIDGGGSMGKNSDGSNSPPAGAGINRDKWLRQLNANPELKERFFRHTLGENQNPLANQAVMEEAANRADIRGNRRFDDNKNLSYFAGYYRGHITAKQRAMLDANFDKVFRQGSDVSKGAIDNSSGWLARKHLTFDHRFKDTIPPINGEHFEVPDLGESGPGERRRYPAFRAAQLREAASRLAASHGARLADMVRRGRPTPRAALEHRSDASGSLSGNAHLKIDLNGFPRGTRTAHAADGIFKQVTLNRGRPMTLGSEVS